MREHRNTRHVAALSIFVCACSPKIDLGEIESDTEMVDGSGTEGETADDASSTGEGESAEGSTGNPDTGDNPPMPGVGPSAVDVLFVIDNSGSMGEEQAALSASIDGMVTALDSSGLNYRIGVTTTDNGNYWCRGSGVSNPEAGNLVFSSCRSRLGEFYFTADMIDQSAACTDYCAIEQIAPTNGVPWIDDNGANLPVGVGVGDALKCLLPQGINGCGFESHLESADLVIRRSAEPLEDELGFIRDDAHLMIVIVSDEVDCSVNRDWETIFLSDTEGGNQVFWSLPEENSPTSAVCWNAGVECTGAGPAFQDCHPQDYDFEGNPTTVRENAVLHPLSRYQDQIDALTASKAASHAQVFVFGILGVPEDYPSSRTIVYTQGSNGNDPNSFQARFGIGEGCTSSSGVAVPPVRMRALMEDNAKTSASPIHSICSGSYGVALNAMVQQVAAFVGP